MNECMNITQLSDCFIECPDTAFSSASEAASFPPCYSSLRGVLFDLHKNLLFWLGGCVSLANHSKNPSACGWSHFTVFSGFPHKGEFRRNALSAQTKCSYQTIGVATGSWDRWVGGALVGNCPSRRPSLTLQEIGGREWIENLETVTKPLFLALQWSLFWQRPR